MTKKLKINGGAKLAPKHGEDIHELTGFTPVQKMLESPSAKLDILAYNSLKGFMFTLNVDKDDSRYNTLGLNSNKFDTPITSFIMKLVVILDHNNFELSPFETISKSSESEKSFFEEAKLQMNIWKCSIENGHPEICPAVANLSIFDKNSSKQFIEFLLTIPETNEHTKTNKILKYLKNILVEEEKYNGRIGLLLMPNIQNSLTRRNFLKKLKDDDTKDDDTKDDIKKYINSYLAAQIVRLFLICKVIHFDLHNSNSLVKNGNINVKKNDYQSIIIDFGIASDLTSGKDDEYLKEYEKDIKLKYIKDNYNTLLGPNIGETIERYDDEYKTKFMRAIINHIYKTDKKFYGSDDDAQMSDFYDDLDKTDLSESFDILKSLIMIDIDKGHIKRPKKTIKRWGKKGYIGNLNDIDDFKSVQLPDNFLNTHSNKTSSNKTQ